MTYFLRSWTDRDTNCDREISQSVYPEYREEPHHPAWFPARQLGAPLDSLSRYIAVETQRGDRVAYATLWELRPRRYRFDLAVRPEWQRQGIGRQLLARIMKDAETFGATGLQARVRDDKHEALEFISRRGFRESHRMGAWRLDFKHVDGAGFQDAFKQLRDRGMEVMDLATARAQDPHYLERFFDLYYAAREGWPDPDPDPTGAITISISQVKCWLDNAQLPEAFFIARHGQHYVAFTSFFSIGTAVHPDYRRKGIASLLKTGSIADAQRRGFQGRPLPPPVPRCKRSLNGWATFEFGARYA
jgi:GNAT superfamily N-acetyltransferase